MPALEGPKSIPIRTCSFVWGVLERTNHDEAPVIVMQDEL